MASIDFFPKLPVPNGCFWANKLYVACLPCGALCYVPDRETLDKLIAQVGEVEWIYRYDLLAKEDDRWVEVAVPLTSSQT